MNVRCIQLLAHEVSLLNELSHENIVKVIGFVEDAKDGIAWMILPWEKNGNLREFIASADWEFPERLALLNILVTSENRAILTDFGSARSLEPTSGGSSQSRAPEVEAAPHPNMVSPRVEVAAYGTTITLTGPAWTLRWAAPELLAGSLPDLASDIWAFGWICWEVMTSNFPFDGENDVSAILQIVEGRLPSVHGDGRLDQVVALANLMIDCWSLDPSKRPTAKTCERHVYWMDRTTPSSRNGNVSSEVRSARLLNSLAYMHIRHNRMSEAMEHLDRSMSIARSTQDDSATANALRGFAGVYRLQGEYSKSEEAYITACDIYARIDDQVGRGNAFTGLGELYRSRGEASKAEESYTAARDIYTRIGHDLGLANTLNGLGQVYLMRGELSKSEESHVGARDVYARIGNQTGFAYATKALADIYRFRGEYFKAEESYIAARDVFNRIGDQIGLANSITRLGHLTAEQDNYTRAEQLYQEAQEIYVRIGDKHSLANTLWHTGRLYRSQRRYEDAERLVSEASTLYKELGLENDVLDCSEFLDAVRKENIQYR
ncbi:Ephrin type-A receptor 8 [Tulasnella sp. 424]|nr:Ephrin type-A receptor 8 [Tulasnella sp. 424]